MAYRGFFATLGTPRSRVVTPINERSAAAFVFELGSELTPFGPRNSDNAVVKRELATGQFLMAMFLLRTKTQIGSCNLIS